MWHVCNQLQFWPKVQEIMLLCTQTALNTIQEAVTEHSHLFQQLHCGNTQVCRQRTRKVAFPRTEGSKLLGSFQRHQNTALKIMSGWNLIHACFINASRPFSMHLHGMYEGLRGTGLIIFSSAKLLLNFFFFTNLKWELMQIKGCH